MITLRAIDRDNYEACIALHVSGDQRTYVAENWYSIIQAAYEPMCFALGIYLDEKMIGMFLYDYDEEIPGWSMSRFMIDQRWQGKGLGKQALTCFLSFFYERHENVDLYTSAELANDTALHLYEMHGFQKLTPFAYEHDGIVYEEMRMVRKVLE